MVLTVARSRREPRVLRRADRPRGERSHDGPALSARAGGSLPPQPGAGALRRARRCAGASASGCSPKTTSTRPRRSIRAAGLPAAMGRGAAPGPHAARERSARHAAGVLRHHAVMPRLHHRVPAVQGRQRPPPRPLSGPRPGVRARLRVLHVLWASAARNTSSARTRSFPRRLPAAQGQPARPGVLQRARSAPASLRLHVARRRHADARLRPRRQPRLRRTSRTRSRPPRARACAVRLFPRPRRTSGRAVHHALPDHGHRDRAGALGRQQPAAAGAMGLPAQRAWFEQATTSPASRRKRRASRPIRRRWRNSWASRAADREIREEPHEHPRPGSGERRRADRPAGARPRAGADARRTGGQDRGGSPGSRRDHLGLPRRRAVSHPAAGALRRARARFHRLLVDHPRARARLRLERVGLLR